MTTRPGPGVKCAAMSKRNRPRTAAEATHRRERHERRSAYNSPENKAARAKAAGAGSTAPAASKRAAARKPAASKPTAG